MQLPQVSECLAKSYGVHKFRHLQLYIHVHVYNVHKCHIMYNFTSTTAVSLIFWCIDYHSLIQLTFPCRHCFLRSSWIG